MERFVPFLRPKIYQPRPSEIAAANASLAVEPFLPPNVDIIMFYGRHYTKRDFEALAPYLAGTDVFVSEMPTWTIELMALHSRISRGDRRARKELDQLGEGRKFSPFTDRKIKALLGSGIRITAIDYSSEVERASEISTHFNNWGLFDKVVPSWHRTLDNIIDFARTEAELEEYREGIMLASIGPRLQTLIDSDQELSQKERVQVLVQQGAAHAFFYPNFAALASDQASTTIRQVFDGGEPMVYDHFDRLVHTFSAGNLASKAERRKLAMRALARTALRFNAIPPVLEDSDRHGWRIKLPPPEEMVERLSPEAIMRFHREFISTKQSRSVVN